MQPEFSTDPDLDQAARFLRRLDPDATQFEFRTFDDNVDRDDYTLTNTYRGPLDRHVDKLRRLNQRGAGVYVTINETDGVGRSADNIIRVRAVFVDLDGSPLAPVMAARLRPHIVVETSPERWHAYWLVDGMALADFTAVQQALITKFNADPTIHDLPRVMRLPGFIHAKEKNGVASKPFVSRIIHHDDAPPYPAINFERAEVADHTSGQQHDVTPMDEFKAACALEVIPNNNLDWRDWNSVGMATWRATGGSEYGFEAFDTWSRKSTKYDEVRTKKVWRGYFKSAPYKIGLGTLMFMADEADPGWRQRFEAEVLRVLWGNNHAQ